MRVVWVPESAAIRAEAEVCVREASARLAAAVARLRARVRATARGAAFTGGGGQPCIASTALFDEKNRAIPGTTGP